MDFGLITDPHKQVPFNWRKVPSMRNAHSQNEDYARTNNRGTRTRPTRDYTKEIFRGVNRGLTKEQIREAVESGDLIEEGDSVPRWF
jgi:hypothetical protein